MIRFRHALLFFAALAVVGFAWAAFANLIQNRPASETVFDNGGARWPFFSQVAAINYDKGGQGVGYNVPVPGTGCTDGAGYRSDAVNMRTSISGAPAIPFQIGCSQTPNSWNYLINISQSGPYQITLQLADDSAGGVWNILIDGVQVATASTPNTGSFDTLANSTSGPFTASLGNHKLTLAWGAGDIGSGGVGDILTWQGSQAPVTTINSVTISCGGSCGFVGGTAGTVGTAQATMSSGSFTGSWSLRTSGTDNFGATCNNYGTGFAINSSTGDVTNGAIANGSYPGVCLVATQLGATGSPFAKAVSITGSASAVPAPAVAAGFNTPILQADFTQTTGFWSNLSNFMTNCGAAASVPNQHTTWHFTFFEDSVGGTHYPCDSAHLALEQDGTNGQTLRRTATVSDINSTTQGSMLGFPTFLGNGGPTSWMPNEMMQIIRYRIDCQTWSQRSDCINSGSLPFVSVALWNTTSNDFSTWVDENDWELRALNTSPHGQWFGGMQEGQNFPANTVDMPNPSTLDQAVYHTLATIFTSNETNVIWECQWIDPAPDYSTGFNGCASISLAATGTYTHRSRYLLMSDNIWFSFPGQASFPATIRIQKAEIWGCAAFDTGTCPGPLITHWP